MDNIDAKMQLEQVLVNDMVEACKKLLDLNKETEKQVVEVLVVRDPTLEESLFTENSLFQQMFKAEVKNATFQVKEEGEVVTKLAFAQCQLSAKQVQTLSPASRKAIFVVFDKNQRVTA